MAAPTYTTDLLPFELCAGAANIVGEFTGYGGGRGDDDDTDYEIQGAAHISKEYNATGLGSLGVEFTTGPGDPVPGWVGGWNFFMWGVFLPAGAVDTYAQGGLRMIVGSDDSNFRVWTVGGSDFGSYPYGGWQNFVVDPETDGDYSDGGTYVSDYGVVGMGVNVIAAISKGNPFGVDAIRYGRGELRVVAGSVGDGYANFAGMATENDLNANMWGLFQGIPGGYLMKGKIVLGYGGAVEFSDTNKTILIDDTRKVLSSFNRIEITTAGSTIDWVNVSITSLGTVARGQLEMIDNATFNDTAGVFTDMDTFIYQSNATINTRTWRRCNQVTQGGATIDACIFESSTADETADEGALLVDDLSTVTDCTFTTTGVSGHAVVYTPIGAGPFNVNWDGHTDSGYSAVDGSTGYETILILPDTTDADINLTVINGATTPTIMEHATYTGDFALIIPEITLTISSQVSLVGAEIRIYDLDTTPPDLGTELDGVESHDAATFVFSGSAANVIYIQIMLAGYVEFGQQTTVPASNGDFYALLEPETN